MATRRPHRVYDSGTDPDPRFSLANERTFLAWVRTALALVAGAVALQAPALDLETPPRLGISCGALVLASTCLAQGWHRWQRMERAMRTGAQFPGFSGGIVLALGAAAIAAGVLLVVLTR